MTRPDTTVPLRDVSCIVVHHASPDTLVHTLESLVQTGITHDMILVVDNSGDNELMQRVQARGFRALHTSNRGYASAVNEGLADLRATGGSRPLTLVCTHEVLADSAAVRMLREAMLTDDRIAVAGPTLINADAGREVWSTGGSLSGGLSLPHHHTSTVGSLGAGAVDRDWLDGAFTLYRTSALEGFELDELYFLYFEETDLHTRLRRAGHRVVWVPDATVSQRSSGIPPRLLGRNLFLFQSRLFSRSKARAAVCYQVARSTARALAGRGPWSAPGQVFAGWLDGERIIAGKPTKHPLPGENGR